MPESATAHPNAPEQRTVTADLRDVRTEGRTLYGYAALYGVESRDLGGYRETIAPGAFADVLASDPDVYLSVNHSPDRVLARTASGTLRLRDEARGLAFEADLGDGPTAQDVRDQVRRGDVTGASFRFKVADNGERWEGERRTLTRIGELIDLSLATTPAYDGPRVELRSAPEAATETTNGGERRQEGGATMPPENQDGAAENRDAEHENTEERTEATEAEQRTESEQRAGTLTVESRDETGDEQRSIEERITEALRGVRKGEARSLTVASDGAIAPPELSSFLFDKLRASSVALQSGIVVIATDRSEVQWPQLTGDVDPAFYDEGDTITAGDPTLATLTANPKKIAHIVQCSNEVIDDSEPSVIDVLNAHLATVLGLKLDLAIFQGAGGTDPATIRGLKSTPGIGSISMGTDGAALTDYDPFLQAVGLLQAANAPGPYVAVMHPRTATELALLKTGASGSVEQLPVPAQMPQVLTTSQLSVTETKGTSSDASSAYVYAPSQLVVVRRQDATVELDRSRLFNSDESEVRGKLRADLLVPSPAAVVRIDGIIPPA